MSAKHLTAFVAVCLVLLSHTVYSEILDYTNEDCIIDKTIAPEEEGNYVDCNTPESIAENKTRCCEIEGSKGCCTNETNANKMIAIGTSIAVVTVCVMSACFIVFWCNPDTIPCLKKCPCKCCQRGSNEFSEMKEMSPEIKKTGITNQTYMRPRDNDEFAPSDRYDMPDELKANVQDDWWGAPPSSAQF